MNDSIDALRFPSRQFFARACVAAAAAAGGVRGSRAQETPSRRLMVAAVFTEFTYRSHAHVILENF